MNPAPAQSAPSGSGHRLCALRLRRPSRRRPKPVSPFPPPPKVKPPPPGSPRLPGHFFVFRAAAARRSTGSGAHVSPRISGAAASQFNEPQARRRIPVGAGLSVWAPPHGTRHGRCFFGFCAAGLYRWSTAPRGAGCVRARPDQAKQSRGGVRSGRRPRCPAPAIRPGQ